MSKMEGDDRMAVYVDQLRPYKQWRFTNYKNGCHLFADTPDELHTFAENFGLVRAWFQDGKYPYYDLTAGKRGKAVYNGAIEVTTRKHLGMKRNKEEMIIENSEQWKEFIKSIDKLIFPMAVSIKQNLLEPYIDPQYQCLKCMKYSELLEDGKCPDCFEEDRKKRRC